MNEKTQVVVFTSNNARILVNPPNVDEFLGKPNAFINPDLSEVIGTPPHFWKVVDGKIVPMSRPEKLARLKLHAANGVDNRVRAMPLPKVRAERPILSHLLAAAIGAAAGALGVWLL